MRRSVPHFDRAARVIGMFLSIAALGVIGARTVRADEKYGLKGQASSWAALNDDRPSTPRFGLRYLPDLSLGKTFGNGVTVDGEVSWNLYANGAAPDWRDVTWDARGKPYRAWARIATKKLELRAGLQKINFGSATLLRPLMWFDRMDARDPLQITDGVTGLLGRYYFVNNANLWAWALYGNDDPKGWETSFTAKRKPELGGRVQLPLFKGEIAATYHHRTADLARGASTAPVVHETGEDRYALDGKWDVVIGVWIEGVMIRQAEAALPRPYQRFLTLGADYTFGLGNGVHVLAEHFIADTAQDVLGGGEGGSFSGLSVSYPLGLLDQISGIVFRDWKNHDFYNLFTWRRTYDNWQVFVMGFWNPEQFRVYRTASGNNIMAGKGAQIMLVFNH